MVSPQREAILAFTCANLGEPAVRALQPLVDQSTELQQLKQVIQRSNTQTYKPFVLLFDQYMIQFKIGANGSEVLPVTQEDYRNLYVQYCGSETANSAGTADRADAGYVWMGV